MANQKIANYFADISGVDDFNRPKSHVALIYNLCYNDGTSIEQQAMTIHQKPVVSVFKHAGFVNVLLDFRSPDDVDLAMAWNLLVNYSEPENSIDWTDDELEEGVYLGEDGKEHMIYFPTIELLLSPIGRETEYIMRGVNPAFYTLAPNDPKGPPCVLQLTFPEDWFFIDTEITPVDMDVLRTELMEELGVDTNTTQPHNSER